MLAKLKTNIYLLILITTDNFCFYLQNKIKTECK